MKISRNGIDLIKEFEGIRLKAYIPVKGDIPTIGYGSTQDVKMGDMISMVEAGNLLKKDLARYVSCVSKYVTVPVNQNQFDACVSFAFNLGCAAFRKSTLLKRINAKQFREASDQFPLWNRAGGRVLVGLTGRRNAERDLFLKVAA